MASSDQQSFQEVREEELLDFIRETVEQLNALGDRLERYAETKTLEGGEERV